MDADSSVSADLVLVALSAPRSRPPPARPRRATRAGPPPVGPVRSTPERTVPLSQSIGRAQRRFLLICLCQAFRNCIQLFDSALQA